MLEDWNNGKITYSKGQSRHIGDGAYWARYPHRGTQLDQELKARVKHDASLKDQLHRAKTGEARPDFYRLDSEGKKYTAWWDLTTSKAFDAHLKKYGEIAGFDHGILYQHVKGSFTGADKLTGKVAKAVKAVKAS